jgi:anti-anti-sigma regulatory factor
LAIRIDVETEGTTRVLHIAGRLEAEAISELEALARDAAGDVLLDLTTLDEADEQGLAALRRLEAGGARLRGVQPYLALRLRAGR